MAGFLAIRRQLEWEPCRLNITLLFSWSMKLSNDIRHGRHCVSALHVHLVFVTKYRRKVFDGDALQRLRAIFEKVCRDFQAQLVEMNGEAEHVHLLIHYPPKHSVSSLVNSLKGVSSRLLRIERPNMKKRYWNNVLWSPSYLAASCGGAPLGTIRQYIEQQKTPL
jgi:putative transposase